MRFEYIFPVITLALGWFLNSFTPILQSRRENRKAFYRAISDLLEIRHHLLSKQLAIEEIKRLCSMSPTDERLLRKVLLNVFPPSGDLSKRYDETVTLIASCDPLLGFSLRSKDYILKVDPFLGSLEAQSGATLPPLTEVEDRISAVAIPHLNKAIVGLARRCGLTMWFKIRRYLGEKPERPKEIDLILEPIRQQIQQAQSSAGQGAAAPVTTGAHPGENKLTSG